MRSRGEQNKFSGGKPGRKWFQLFRTRHRNISMRVAENITKTRAAISEKGINDWFQQVTKYLTDNGSFGALSNPKSIFNLDETAVFLSPDAQRVLAPRGARIVYNVIKNNDKECVTALLGGNAEGLLCHDLLDDHFQKQNLPPKGFKTFARLWDIGLSENGWMTTTTFTEYIEEIFYPFLLVNEIPFPVIVFLDGHSSHLTFETQEFCRAQKIWLIPLYPNTTHILQPMDVTCFRTLKYKWREAIHECKATTTDASMNKETFCDIFYKVVTTSLQPHLFKSGFDCCSIITSSSSQRIMSIIANMLRPKRIAAKPSRKDDPIDLF